MLASFEVVIETMESYRLLNEVDKEKEKERCQSVDMIS